MDLRNHQTLRHCQGIRTAAAPMGGRTNLRLARPMPAARKGLRSQHPERRCLDPHRPHPPPHKEAGAGMKSCQPFGHEILPTFMSQTLIDRPSPVPSPAGLVVKNGLNIFSLTSSGIPVPLSRIRISTLSPRFFVEAESI